MGDRCPGIRDFGIGRRHSGLCLGHISPNAVAGNSARDHTAGSAGTSSAANFGVFERTKEKARALIGHMPRVDSLGVPNTDVLHADENALAETVKEIAALAPGLPTAFGLRAVSVPLNFITAGTEVYLFSRSCSLEKVAAAGAHRDWSWDGARRSYLAEVRDPERHHPEWDDLVGLTTLHRAVKELSNLEVDITSYLLSPAQRIST